MFKNILTVLVAAGGMACGSGKKDELTPYIKTLQGLEIHSQKLVRYRPISRPRG